MSRSVDRCSHGRYRSLHDVRLERCRARVTLRPVCRLVYSVDGDPMFGVCRALSKGRGRLKNPVTASRSSSTCLDQQGVRSQAYWSEERLGRHRSLCRVYISSLENFSAFNGGKDAAKLQAGRASRRNVSLRCLLPVPNSTGDFGPLAQVVVVMADLLLPEVHDDAAGCSLVSVDEPVGHIVPASGQTVLV